MGIRKSKHPQVDIDGLMDGICADHQIQQETAATKERLEELRIAQATLQEATESLKQATAALNEAVVTLNATKGSADNIVSGICRVIVDAQKNAKFKVQIEREDLEQMMNLSQAALKTDEILMEQHRTAQLQNMEEHERKVANILSRNKGVWISDFWMKVLAIAILVYTLLTFLYVEVKT